MHGFTFRPEKPGVETPSILTSQGDLSGELLSVSTVFLWRGETPVQSTTPNKCALIHLGSGKLAPPQSKRKCASFKIIAQRDTLRNVGCKGGESERKNN